MINNEHIVIRQSALIKFTLDKGLSNKYLENPYILNFVFQARSFNVDASSCQLTYFDRHWRFGD